MIDSEKSIIRAEFAQQLITADFNQEQLEEYLTSGLNKSPSEWLAAQDGVSDEEMKAYLEDEFPKEK